jgi:hypothetical protein
VAANGLIGINSIEQRLQEVGVRGKVIPSADALPGLAQDARRGALKVQVDEALTALLRMDAIVDHVVEQFEGRIGLEDARGWIEAALAEKPTLSWNQALDHKIARLAEPLAAEIRIAVRTAVRTAVDDEEHDDVCQENTPCL